MTRARRWSAFPLFLASLVCQPALAADTGLVWSAAYGAGYDSNVGNSASPRDERDAANLTASAGAGWERRFGSYTALQISGGVAAEKVFELDDLSSARATVRMRVRHKPGRGFYAPVLAAWASFGGRDYGSPIRDSFDYRAGVSLTEPLTTAMQVRAEATGSRRDSRSRVYDVDGFSWSLNLDWAVSPRATLYGSIGSDDTPIVVSADGHGMTTPKTQHLYLTTYAEAIEPDAAFGRDWWAFRMDGRSTVITAGVNVPLSSTMALDFQLRRAEAEVRRFSYERLLGGASVLMRW